MNAIDILAQVNYLTIHGTGQVPSGGFVSAPFCDVNNDVLVNAIDVLVLVNHLTRNPSLSIGGEGEGGAEGEGGGASDDFFARLGSGGSVGGDDDDLFDLLAQG